MTREKGRRRDRKTGEEIGCKMKREEDKYVEGREWRERGNGRERQI